MTFDAKRVDGKPVEKQYIVEALEELIGDNDEFYVDDSRYQITDVHTEIESRGATA